MNGFGAATWPDIDRLRAELTTLGAGATDVETAAGSFASTFRRWFASCALARVFVVVPFSRLPSAERAWAEQFANRIGRTEPLDPKTAVLTLAGTSGVEPAWNDRTRSQGHRAIPLIDRRFVEGAPMIAALLSSIGLDPSPRYDGPIELRAMPGGLNARFLVEDAPTTKDDQGRLVIGAREFVTEHGIRTVFGMGGSYVGGEMAVAVLFTTETLRALDVDRFTSLIATFKMATAKRMAEDEIFASPR